MVGLEIGAAKDGYSRERGETGLASSQDFGLYPTTDRMALGIEAGSAGQLHGKRIDLPRACK